MTLAADAISVIAVQGNPIMVTEYGSPSALLLNLGTETVYVGTTSSVSSSTGVPLAAGSFISWTTDNAQIWVIVDPGAPAGTACQVTMTERIADWAPSPAAVAGIVAAELIASGIHMNVINSVLESGRVFTDSATVVYDVEGFQSLNVSLDAANTNLALNARVQLLVEFRVPGDSMVQYHRMWTLNTTSGYFSVPIFASELTLTYYGNVQNSLSVSLTASTAQPEIAVPSIKNTAQIAKYPMGINAQVALAVSPGYSMLRLCVYTTNGSNQSVVNMSYYDDNSDTAPIAVYGASSMVPIVASLFEIIDLPVSLDSETLFAATNKVAIGTWYLRILGGS